MKPRNLHTFMRVIPLASIDIVRIDQRVMTSSIVQVINNSKFPLRLKVNQLKSNETIIYLFTKSFPKATFEKCVKIIGMFKLSQSP